MMLGRERFDPELSSRDECRSRALKRGPFEEEATHDQIERSIPFRPGHVSNPPIEIGPRCVPGSQFPSPIDCVGKVIDAGYPVAPSGKFYRIAPRTAGKIEGPSTVARTQWV
jgi:hypothetical protein